MKVQELHGEDVYKPKNKRDMDNFLNDDESQMQILEEDDENSYRQKVRSKEITKIVNTINDLAVLFKDLSVLVVE